MKRIRRILVASAVVGGILAPTAPAIACYGTPCNEISYVCYQVEPLLKKAKIDPACALG